MSVLYLPIILQTKKLYEVGDILKLSYFELLSPAPVNIENVGGIISPTLKDISSIGINTYQYYLTILQMDLKTYFTLIGQAEEFEQLSDEDKMSLNIFDLLTMSTPSIDLLQNILNFFFKENVIYSSEHKIFFVQSEDEVIGTITKEHYPEICDLICQRNRIQSNHEEDLSKVKSKKALEIMNKLKKGRAEKSKQASADKNMELGNIISAVANKSQSLNIINIWDLTVYQVWDCFSRLSNNSIYDIQSMSVAAWGNKDNFFDATAWFKRIDTID